MACIYDTALDAAITYAIPSFSITIHTGRFLQNSFPVSGSYRSNRRSNVGHGMGFLAIVDPPQIGLG